MLSLVSALMGPLAVFALGTGVQTDKAEAPVPTAIERALMDRACIGTETTSAESYAHRECIDAKLLSLRADFGHDFDQATALAIQSDGKIVVSGTATIDGSMHSDRDTSAANRAITSGSASTGNGCQSVPSRSSASSRPSPF